MVDMPCGRDRCRGMHRMLLGPPTPRGDRQTSRDRYNSSPAALRWSGRVRSRVNAYRANPPAEVRGGGRKVTWHSMNTIEARVQSLELSRRRWRFATGAALLLATCIGTGHRADEWIEARGIIIKNADGKDAVLIGTNKETKNPSLVMFTRDGNPVCFLGSGDKRDGSVFQLFAGGGQGREDATKNDGTVVLVSAPENGGHASVYSIDGLTVGVLTPTAKAPAKLLP